MADEAEVATTALAHRPLAGSAELISDDEVRRMFRIAEALALSGSFKGVNKPEQAFAKMIIGRDFGMTPAQAMTGIHLVDGGVQVHYSMIGQFIRSRKDDGYDYRVGWLKQSPAQEGAAPTRELVWMDEDDPTDQREVVGASVTFWAGGEVAGVSTFDFEDAVQANLIKDGLDKRAAWSTARRNMYLARAMSNGAKWIVPEVMGGLPIYVEGEIVPRAELTKGEGSGEAQGLDLGPQVEWVIERATELGHAGFSDRAAIEVALGKRSPAVVNAWVTKAKADLAAFAQRQAEKDAKTEDEVTDAVVVEETSPSPSETQAAPAADTAEQPPEADHHPSPAGAATEGAPGSAAAEPESMDVKVLRSRLTKLREMRSEAQDPDDKSELDSEIDHVEAALRELGIEQP